MKQSLQLQCLAAFLCLAGLLMGCGKSESSNKRSEKSPLNIIVILADDIGVENIGAYGGEYHTPYIDSLAANGVRFDQGHATPVCTTSRSRLLAGTHNFKHYKAFAHLDPELYSLPRYLNDAGYNSVVAGKWQLAGNMEYGGTGSYPWDLGFDEHIVWQLERTLKGGRYWQPTFTENHNNKTYCKDDFGPTILNDYILDFIDRNAEQPFFVYYNPILAHDPWTTTPDSLDAETPKEKFSGMMTYLDKMVGRVLAKLDEHGLTENTLIWFIGDNGTHPQITSTRNGKPITGGKWNTKTAGTHVPYIMQWKEEMPAGIVKNGLVELLDVYTTLQSAVGHPNETELDGVDLIPYVKGEANHTRDSVFMHYDPQWGADYFNTPMPAARFI
ncbi:MAG: sulfatase-like hydrolase/transferase, partial [Opitutales bacterium]|nr:sulfatase-like hydrolase/transferase [Opitutales bacterium]